MELKEQLYGIIERLSLCEDLADATERNDKYKACCSELAALAQANRANPVQEVTDLIAQAYAIQRSVAGICSVKKSELIAGFIKTEDSIDSSSFKTRVRANILKAKAKINAMGGDPRSQGNARGFLLTMCNLKISAADSNGHNTFKTVQVISTNHPEIKALWLEYTKKAEAESQKELKMLEEKADKTAQETERLAKIRDQALPRLKARLKELGQ